MYKQEVYHEHTKTDGHIKHTNSLNKQRYLKYNVMSTYMNDQHPLM